MAMHLGTFLTDSEIKDLTRRTRRDAQVRVLRFMGIAHRLRPDGTVAVLRGHVEMEMGGTSRDRPVVNVEPNWAAI